MAMDEKFISGLLGGRFKWCSLKMYGNFWDSCLEGEPNGILDKPLQRGFLNHTFMLLLSLFMNSFKKDEVGRNFGVASLTQNDWCLKNFIQNY
jgi:hypothetical protein